MDTDGMQKIDSSNTMFTLAADLVNHTATNIFLTGKAGTGKTTFLKYIRENCPKQMVVVAPTGVAAINAGGVTIHSFFQLPFSPFVPEAKGFTGNSDEVTDKHSLLGRLRLNSDRRKIIQELELLIIDEISMVRCDVLDAVDAVLRHVRRRYLDPFGGVQVLFIGDMFQLPPVVKEQEWGLLRPFYASPYFFDSQVIKDGPPVYIEFNKIYRQTDESFIRLLNQVRNNEVDEDGFAALHERYMPQFFGDGPDGYILLTTHNEKARAINTSELEKLDGKSFGYEAEITGDFPANAFPADEKLQLKVGSQVMFIKNDTDKEKRYFNGKIGVVSELTADKIVLQCKNEPLPIEVKKEKWDNIRYALNKASRQLEEEVLGSFSQYPLRLAWAITIHKSQGLTFEKAVIDAGDAFAPGQVYVALSRCTSLQGLVLHSKVRANSFFTDARIVAFSNTAAKANEVEEKLSTAKKDYQEKVLLSLFDFDKTSFQIKELSEYLIDHRSSFNEPVFLWSEGLMQKLQASQTTAEKFQHQLKRLFPAAQQPEGDPVLQERLKAGADYFTKEINALINLISQSPAITDSRLNAKEYNDLLREVFAQLSLQNYLLQGFGGKFDMAAFHRRKKNFALPHFSVNAYAASNSSEISLKHPELFYQLKQLRDSICSKKNLPIYLVASGKTLEEMTTYLPQNLDELEQISGFGKTKIDAYGDRFLKIVTEYCLKNGLSSNIAAKTPKRQRKENKGSKVDTKAETFRLYKDGNTVEVIATQRNLTPTTIEGHLAHFVRRGAIKIEELVSREKIVLIEPVAKTFEGGSVTTLKEKLGNDVSFGEIRLVLASLEFRRALPSHVNH